MFTDAAYGYCIGAFDRDVTKFFALPERETASRLIELIGGVERVCEVVEQAFERHEYAWAAQLIQYAFRMSPDDARVREIKARACRTLGQISTSAIARSWLLTEALICEGAVTLPPFVPPRPEIVTGLPTEFVNYFRVRVDPQKAEGIDCFVGFAFGKLGEQNTRDLSPAALRDFAGTCGLHCRRGVVEFVANLGEYDVVPSVGLAMSPETWAKIYLSEVTLADAITAGEVQCFGNKEQAVALFECFDVWPQLTPATPQPEPGRWERVKNALSRARGP